MNVHTAVKDEEQKAKLNRIIDDIAATKDDVERWRKIANFAVNSSPAAKAQHKAVLQEVKEAREQLTNDFGASKEHMRHALKIPRVVNEMLEAFGEDLFKSYRTPEQSKQHLRKVAKAFPEYRVYKSI